MSHVTTVLLSFSISEERVEGWDSDSPYILMNTINAWLIEHGYGAFGQDIDHVSGGHKHLETPLYAAGFNYFGLGDFLGMLRTLPWREPANVQVFVQAQDEEKFRMIDPCTRGDGDTVISDEMREVIPVPWPPQTFWHTVPITPEQSVMDPVDCWTVYPDPICRCGRYRLQWK